MKLELSSPGAAESDEHAPIESAITIARSAYLNNPLIWLEGGITLS